jgi:hypothetical protein
MPIRLNKLAILCLVATACTEPSSETGAPRPPSPPDAAPLGGTLALGERITAHQVPLAEIAKNPTRFQGEVVATSGKVTAVCQERGCWMQLEDATGQAHVRMHGHAFFVPKTAPGHVARVQARILPAQGGGENCDTKPPDPNGLARVELDATGVEID